LGVSASSTTSGSNCAANFAIQRAWSAVPKPGKPQFTTSTRPAPSAAFRQLSRRAGQLCS
jgi:hypothetical protein